MRVGGHPRLRSAPPSLTMAPSPTTEAPPAPPPAARASWFERHPALTMLAVLGVVGLGLDLAAGTAYRLATGHAFFERPQVEAMRAYEAEQDRYRTASDVYDHDLRPLVSDTVAWGGLRYAIHTNSLGFKDRAPRAVPLAADRHRLLFIGDSFTEGVGYPYEATFVGLVDSALAPRGVEVLNAGVSSYSPLIYWRKLAHWIGERGLDVDEVAVFVDISDASNDAELYTLGPDGAVRHTDAPPDPDARAVSRPPGSGRLGWLKDALKYNTVVLATLVQLKLRLNPPLAAANFPLDKALSRWTFDAATYEAYGREGERRMTAHMDSLHALLAARGIPMTVAVYPWPDQIAAGDLDSRQVRLWRGWAAARGARFVNYFPALVTGATAEERTAVLERYYINGDYHWNAAGHRLVAEGFLDAYTVPPDVRPTTLASIP